ncbi:MAG: glycosyl hydrolase [Candidatus Sumerlaeia bacterium]|nr:glycosyl hydrolase [Candidatus Sumerlaeia bacterium]
MNQHVTTAAACLLLLLGARGVVGADSINVNFRGLSGDSVTGTAGVYAEPASGAVWNNFTGTSGSAPSLLSSVGTASGAALAWQAQASWQAFTPGAGQNENLMDGYLAVGSEEFDYDITVTGIPYASYDVYVYFGNNSMGADGNLRLNGGGTQFFYRTAGILPAFTGFQRVTARTSEAPQDGNYALFEGVAGGTLVIQQANVNGGQDSGVMGFQIVDRGAAIPGFRLNESVFSSSDPIELTFATGPGAASNSFILVEQGANPATAVPLARRYVGGDVVPGAALASGTVAFPNAGGQVFGWFDIYWVSDNSGSTIIDGPETIQVIPPEPTVVPVGAGSYASAPPSHEGTPVLTEVYKRVFYIDESAADRPVPTTDWWTDLVISRYSGDLWAYPLTISADALGANVFFPTAWAGDGGQMVLDSPIEVHGEVVPDVDPSVVPIADFEGGANPGGWVRTGTAFPAVPASGTLPGQSAVSGFIGSGLANSFNGGDGPVGKLTSPDFSIDRDYLHFLIGGGNHPSTFSGGDDATSTAVNLIVGGTVVRSATGANSEAMSWVLWDVQALAGQTGRLEIVDNATGGWGHVLCDAIFLSDSNQFSSGAASSVFSPVATDALDWGDWTVTARMEHSTGKHIDMTFGHGLPYAWFEASNVEPILRMNPAATFFDTAGAPVSLAGAQVRDVVGVTVGGRHWGLFLPDATSLQFTGGALRLTFGGSGTFFVLSPLPSMADLAQFHNHAYSVPRDSLFNWEYFPEQGRVNTQWNLVTDQLKGTANGVIQGWIPHHYRNTTNNLALAGLEYNTPRGRLKCAVGNSFQISFPFNGMAPMTPAPAPTGLANDYSASIMANELARAATVTGYGAETYFGGKDLGRFAQYMAMATETGNSASAATLMNSLRAALTDWFTYTPGEREHYFARYPNYRGMVGFNESFYSYQFTDHHFHYGYFTTAMALATMYDPAFGEDYGEFATLLAKDYANWDRNDTDFPFLRSFDIWAGHSLAGGFSSGAGNNQESSSEAMQSWAGLLFLGEALGNEEMAACGAMGAAIESAAVMEYWFNYHGDTLPVQYPWTIVGILFDRGPAFATFFSGDPAWIYGIQWLPLHPTILGYLGRDPVFAAAKYSEMVADRTSTGNGPTDIGNLGSGLGNVLLGYLSLYDPGAAAAEWARLDGINSPVVQTIDTGGLTYYFTHSMRTLGPIQWDHHLSEPLGNVFRNAATDVTTYVAFNPTPTEREVSVYQNGLRIGCFTASPNGVTAVTALSVCDTSGIPDALIIY